MPNKKHKNTRKNRTPKPLLNMVSDLDSHIYILRQQLDFKNISPSKVKLVSTELRTLICYSSGTDGLIWRLTKKIGESDEVDVHVVWGIDKSNILASSLQQAYVPLERAGNGPKQLPSQSVSFEKVVKNGLGYVNRGEEFKYEYIIKAVAQQMGSAHEDDGLEQLLVDMNGFTLNGKAIYEEILVKLARFAIEIGERLISKAEQKLMYKRIEHTANYGDFSIVVSCDKGANILANISPVEVFNICSYASNTQIILTSQKGKLLLTLSRGHCYKEYLEFKPQGDIDFYGHYVITISYCSKAQMIRVLINDSEVLRKTVKGYGWVYSEDLCIVKFSNEHFSVEKHYLLILAKLFSKAENGKQALLSKEDGGLLKTNPEERKDPFPD